MPCNATSQLTNAPSVPLQVTMPTNNAQWAVFVQRLQAAINATRNAASRQPVNVVPADFAVYNGSSLPALSIIGATSALDTTKHQFGAASLKLTATASTVTVEFSANPILLQPNARWIESVYIQSSRSSIAGTLAIDTPAGSYPVDISGTLLPGTWGRLYGDCDLTADFSTTATMVLTLTGCSVGDTFNLEGWQIEAGTGNLPSPFVNTTVPQTYVDTASNASEALANANAAQMSANQANTQLAQVASDGVLSPAEKPIPIRDYSVVTTEQAGIDAQAVAYLGASSAQQVAYDNAITALTNYLNSLTTPVAWNNKSGNTTIVAATFDSTWNTVYEKRQILLNAIYQQAQSLANAAQSTANTAQTTGTNAQNTANTANTTATTANANTPTVINPNFANGLTNWIAAQGWTSDATPRAIYTGFAGASGTLTLANTNNVPCQPGSQIIGQALLSSNAANGACYAGVEFLDSTGAHLAYAFGNSITGTTTATLSRKVALAPASSAFARFFLGAANCTTGTYYAQSCLMTVTLSTLDELPDSGSRFAAAQAGADKTSLNTAADTTKVNGVSSSSISPIAALMPQEAGANKTETRTSALTASLSNQTQDALGDGTTYARMKLSSLTGNDFDFAKGGVNKHLGNVPDGGSRYAVINGAGLKAVSSVDANNRAGIDFTQSVHVGKSLANIPDDAIGGRFATRVDTFANRPTAGVQGRLFHAYNQGTNGITYYDTGTAWQQVAVGHLADIQGTTDNVAEGANKFAGEHGADITGNHNSATTTKLATARNIAGLAFDGTASIAPTLANIPDDAGATRFAVSNIDGNRRALIDATQAGHVGAWNLDSRVADGTTFARVNSTNLTSNNVDLAKSGVQGRVLANIGDDATSGRYAVSSIDGNRRALIDFTQASHIGKSLANIPDDATSTRYAVSSIDGNRRALIDATQAGHVGAWNLDSRVADGTTYARTSSGALTGGNVDLAKAGVVNKNLGNIADGGGRYGVHAVDGNNLALIDFSQAGHVNKTIDNVGDGATYLRMPGANMDANRRGLVDFTQAGHVGKVLDNIGDTGSYVRTPATSWHPENVPNASFTSPAVNGAVPGWGAVNATLSIVAAGGPQALQVVATTTGVAGAYFTPSNACQPGDVVAATVTCDVTAGSSPTARVQVQCFDVNGNALTPTGNYDVAVTSAYYTFAAATALATMPANAASFRLFAYVNSSAGATFLILNPRVSVNDLRVAGSGSQVGDQRNLLPTTWAGVRSVLSTSPIAFSITSGSPNSTVNFSTTAFTNYGGNGVSIPYNAASGSHAQVNGTTATYYLYFLDPTSAGGSQTLQITVFPQTLGQASGAVLIGTCVVTVAAGGGGSSGTGSGGGGYCVVDSMWIDAGTQAKDAQPGHVFDCCDLPTRGTETFRRALRSVDYHDEACVRLTTEGGAQLDCGHTTPFDTVDGCVLRAPDMLGELVLTDHGLQKVVDVEWIGMRRVCYFHFGGISYASGRDTRPWWLRVLPQWLLPRRLRRNVNRIYSHNGAIKP